MPRAKKQGEKISLYMDKATVKRIRAYAGEKGQTLTMAIERAIEGFLDKAMEAEQDKATVASDSVALNSGKIFNV